MAWQVFGKSKCFDTKKAERYFKERRIRYQYIDIVKYGMSDSLGTRSFGGSGNEVFIGRDLGYTKDYSEDVAAKIDEEIKNIIDECYTRCEQILKDHAVELEKTAKLLLEKEKVDADEFDALFNQNAYYQKSSANTSNQEESETETDNNTEKTE